MPDQLVSTHTQHLLLMDLQYTLGWIKWKEQQERYFNFKAPKIASVSSPLPELMLYLYNNSYHIYILASILAILIYYLVATVIQTASVNTIKILYSWFFRGT